ARAPGLVAGLLGDRLLEVERERLYHLAGAEQLLAQRLVLGLEPAHAPPRVAQRRAQPGAARRVVAGACGLGLGRGAVVGRGLALHERHLLGGAEATDEVPQRLAQRVAPGERGRVEALAEGRAQRLDRLAEARDDLAGRGGLLEGGAVV